MTLHDLFRHAGTKRSPPPAIATHSWLSLRGAPDKRQNPPGGHRARRRYGVFTDCSRSMIESSTTSTCVSR